MRNFTLAVYVYVDASDDGRNFPEEIRSEYIVTKELGAGACGKVYLVFEKVNIEQECRIMLAHCINLMKQSLR